MYIIIERNFVFRALQNILSFVGGVKSSLPILGHILLEVRNNSLFMVGTDIDIEIVVYIPIYKIYDIGQITVPAKKFFDICRALSAISKITLRYQESKLFISSESSSFSLVTFPPSDFPNMSVWDTEIEFTVSSNVLKNLIELTQFSMGKRDVRYYLNGMLFEFDMKNFCAVATDGHRLSYCAVPILSTEVNIKSSFSIIVPRKYIVSVTRMLNINEKQIKLKIGRQNISIMVDDYVVTSKLINGTFPNYKSVFPKDSKFVLEVDVEKLQQAIKRAIILCNEKFHVVRFLLGVNRLKIISSNSEHELSEQFLDVVYSGREMEIGFNIYYIVDILNVIRSSVVHFLLTDEHSSVKIVSYPMDINIYIIMPIRL